MKNISHYRGGSPEGLGEAFRWLLPPSRAPCERGSERPGHGRSWQGDGAWGVGELNEAQVGKGTQKSYTVWAFQGQNRDKSRGRMAIGLQMDMTCLVRALACSPRHVTTSEDCGE
jgi:hypothetical protein